MIDGLTGLLAFAPQPQGEGGGASWLGFLPMVLIFVIFYVLLIAPARKKQKKHAEMVDALKNGDRVITNGGIYGTIVGVADQIVQLRIADQVKIEVAKHAIADKQSAEE